MNGDQSFADDPKAQEYAEEIEKYQTQADAELGALQTSVSPKLKVGAAMQHAQAQAKADKARANLLGHTGMAV